MTYIDILLVLFTVAVVVLGAWRVVEHVVDEYRRVGRDVDFVVASRNARDADLNP